MPAPDDRKVIDDLYATGRYRLDTHADLCVFTADAVIALHAKDPKWGHLKKSGGQSQCDGHAEDSALYNDGGAAGTLQSVDFVAGAGFPGAHTAWQPDTPRYSASDWFAPTGTPVPGPTPTPIPVPIVPGREEALDEMKWLDSYYSAPEGLQRPNGLSLNGKPDFEGIAAWYLDVYQQDRIHGKSRADARANYVNQIRHSDEWKQKHPGETP